MSEIDSCYLRTAIDIPPLDGYNEFNERPA